MVLSYSDAPKAEHESSRGCHAVDVTVEQAAPEPLPQSPEADIITGPGIRLATRSTIRRDVRAYLLERNWAPEALDAIGL